MRQITKQKLKYNLKRKKLGDTLSWLLSSFDLLNLLSAEGEIKIENKKQIINAWIYLHTYYLRENLIKTARQILEKEKKRFEIIDLEDIEEAKNKRLIQMGDFNKLFKQNYAEDYDVIQNKIIINKLFLTHKNSLHTYLNKEVIKEVSEAPQNIKGDVAYLEI